MYGADTYAGGDNVNNRETIFQITSRKLYVPIVTLSTKDNINLTKQLHEGLKDQCIGININQKQKQKKQMSAILKDFLLMILFKGLIDCLFLLLIIQIMVLIRLKETVIENISYLR